MYQITAPDCSEITVSLPASKSVTHRIFILSALNLGRTTVNNWLDAEDTERLRELKPQNLDKYFKEYEDKWIVTRIEYGF